MNSIVRTAWMPAFAVALVVGAAACARGDDDSATVPIVVEESGPIALGGADSVPFESEVQLVDDEPEVVTRTVYVRERPVAREPVRNTPVRSRDPEPAPAPRVSAIPSGTSIPIEILGQIDSENHNVGDAWSGRVTRDVVVGGRVVIPAGAAVSGVVSGIEEGDANGGRGYITLDPRSVETVSGTRSIAAAPVSAGTSYQDEGFPSRETAIGAGAGAAIGAIVGGKKGAVIGAAAGGAGGAAMGSARRDYEVRVAAGTVVTSRVESSVDI